MPIKNITIKNAKEGINSSTDQQTIFQIKSPSMELLVGGPYKDHPYGHTAIRLTTKDQDTIYDYGRYGRTWGTGDSEGDGILRIWNNFDSYIAEENSLKRITTGFLYKLDEVKIQAVINFFNKKIKNKNPTSTTKTMKSYIIEDYYALGTNCTTISVSAAKVATPEIDEDWKIYQKGNGLSIFEKSIVNIKGWPNNIFMPADLQEMLTNSKKQKPDKIKIYKK
jgi:hypothetical protein